MTVLANVLGRATIVSGSEGFDLEAASDRQFGPDPQSLYARWDEFLSFVEHFEPDPERVSPTPIMEGELLAPAPFPTQVFAIGLNYRSHAEERGFELPERLAVFTKYPTCIGGGFDEVVIPEGGHVDHEVELVVVIGRRAYRIADWEAWSHVAGVCVGNDFSERILQQAAGNQYSMGKSFPGFGPLGPFLVTPDELEDPDDLALSCAVNGEIFQQSRTSEMVFSVPRIIEELSAVVPLLPGDVIFTGTPSGVGWATERYLEKGDTVECSIEGIGTIRNVMGSA